LISAVAWKPLSDEVVEDTAQRITRLRASEEGREGMTAFLEKRKPNWITQG
jgi:methylglutaconyl-CoA hydratase